MAGSSSAKNNDHEKAETLIEEGNECVKASKFDDAVEKYSEAIELYRDPAHLCNRAAAYCNLKQYDLAIKDCNSALELDDKCAKAYGRIGLVHYYQNRYDASLEAHEAALALDPFYMLGEDYVNHLDVIKEKVREAQNFCVNLFGGSGGVADFSDFMNNEYVMQAAKEMMNDQNMRNLIGSMMEQFMGGTGAGGDSFIDILASGQTMAQHMQQANLQLLEQIRQRIAETTTTEGGGEQILNSSTEESQHSESSESLN